MAVLLFSKEKNLAAPTLPRDSRSQNLKVSQQNRLFRPISKIMFGPVKITPFLPIIICDVFPTVSKTHFSEFKNVGYNNYIPPPSNDHNYTVLRKYAK